jgi:beta-lactamase superfamily II metal-dependent hydrolase
VEEALAAGREILSASLEVEALADRKFETDTTKPNGAAIAFLAEYDRKKILMGADSHPDLIESSLRALGFSEKKKLRLDCLKVSHHGSKANTSPSLLKIIDCTRFAFSTDGTRHGHPNPELIARILVNDPSRKKFLIFNFRQPSTCQWDDDALKAKWMYDCLFPDPHASGIEIDI